MGVKQSLFLKLALGIALLSILIVAAHSVAIFLVTEDQEEQLIDQIIADELENLIAEYKGSPDVAPIRSRYLSGYVTRSSQELASLPPHLQNLSDGVYEIFLDGTELHVGVRTLPQAKFHIVYDVTQHETRMQQFKWLLFLGAVVTGLVAVWLGRWLSGSILKPMSDLAYQVSGRTPGMHEENLASRYDEEEIKRLAAAFDEYAHRIEDALAREQEFTANVSHELRTPLTSIRTSCELLSHDRSLGPEAGARLERIARAVERMSALVKSLLDLARSGQFAQPEEFALRECVVEVVGSLSEGLSGKPIETTIEIAPEVVLYLAREALVLVLTNLVKNAIDNTDRGKIVVGYTEGVLYVEDTGRGIREEETNRIFQRFYRADAAAAPKGGFGLGLAIVARVCDLYDWKLRLASKAARGTRVSITLPTASHGVLRREH